MESDRAQPCALSFNRLVSGVYWYMLKMNCHIFGIHICCSGLYGLEPYIEVKTVSRPIFSTLISAVYVCLQGF